MKKRMKILLPLLLIFSLLFAVPAYADTGGDGNIDGGGGGMGGGNNNSFWNPGNEGVRVTVVRASDHAAVTTPIDLINKSPSSLIYHFGKVSKLQYNNGTPLKAVQGGYTNIKPPVSVPKVISTNGTNNIAALKEYFCSEFLVQLVANHTGMNYSVLIGGQYKLLLEPLAYYKYAGYLFAATATEAALYDQQVSGDLRYWMGKLTHQNLPLAMFLEVSDLGYPAWSGSTSGKRTNEEIKSSLGIGIVRFAERPEPPAISAYDYEYRVNTEVITAVTVSGGQSDPDSPTSVSFRIGGSTYNVGNVYYPEGDSQLAWIRWTTPDTAQELVIDVSVSGAGGTEESTINVKIVDWDKNPPPNPVADDRNDSFTHAAIPNRPQQTSTSWGVWHPWWQEHWVWHSESCTTSCPRNCSGGHGSWCDHGWWAYDFDRYSASASASMSLTTDSKNPTASGNTMKSGYGVNQTVTGTISTNQRSAVTELQNAVSYFPEFRYETYWRLLERMGGGQFEFQQNPYSTYRNRTHFTPIWMPDGSYTVSTWALDSWTPAGMLSLNLTDSLNIRGSLWDDWHVAPLKPE